LHRSYGFERTAENPNALLAPQANIMKVLVEGVMGGNLPWVLIFAGMGAALVVELLGLPALPFAVGLYLPLELSTPIMVGGIIRWLVVKARRRNDDAHDPGVLGASGLVAGHGLVGIAFAGAAYVIARFWNNPQFVNPLSADPRATSALPEHLAPWLMGNDTLPLRYGLGEFGFDLLPVVPFAVLVLWLLLVALRRPPEPGAVVSGRSSAPAEAGDPSSAPLEPESSSEQLLTESRFELPPMEPAAPTEPEPQEPAQDDVDSTVKDQHPDTWYVRREPPAPDVAAPDQDEPPSAEPEAGEAETEPTEDDRPDQWPPPSKYSGD
jgi:hypothetical protein